MTCFQAGKIKIIDAHLWPHPGLVCGEDLVTGIKENKSKIANGGAKAHHNADWIQIGNFDEVGADNIVVVWVPETWHDQAHATAAFATYVKNTRAAGKDTIGFLMRVRAEDLDWGRGAFRNSGADRNKN